MKETHIDILRAALKNWATLTDTDREQLGEYHTYGAILMTLKHQEDSLPPLRGQIHCIEHEIESAKELLSKAETSQQSGLEPGKATGRTDGEGGMNLER